LISTFYPITVQNGGGIMAKLDIVSPAGTVEGWAMYRDSAAVCHVQVRLGDDVVAEDMADRFRPDLLQAGLGHGHCAFYARMAPLPPGTYALRLHDGRTGAPMDEAEFAMHEVPLFEPRGKVSVETLLTPRNRWRDADIIAAPACLQLGYNLVALGVERLVDRMFLFALGRWADPDGARHYAEVLAAGQQMPEDVMVTLLTSAERRSQSRDLTRPIDPDYPFLYLPQTPDL
jgi:hypothetical protein